jgi:cysteine desulfurase
MSRAYLDHNATSPMRPEAAAFAAAVAEGGNPSSVHAEGRRARARIEAARETVATATGASPEAVVFTSGATEAINLAIGGAAAASATRRILISAVEHDCVRESAAASGAAVETIPVTGAGLVDLDWLEGRLREWRAEDGRPFVAVMHANNETGVIQPIADVRRLVAAADGLLLIDAAQTLGKIDVRALGADYLALSAHKLGGPSGAGALVLEAVAPLARRQHGGGQERGRRAGTENLAGIAGFGAAVAAASADAGLNGRLAALRDALEARVRAARPDVQVWGGESPRLGTTSCLALPGFRGETQVMALDLAGVAVSAGAACSSGKVRPSHVLSAMGADAETAGCAIRVSLGWNTTRGDVDRFVEAYLAAAERAAPLSPERGRGQASPKSAAADLDGELGEEAALRLASNPPPHPVRQPRTLCVLGADLPSPPLGVEGDANRPATAQIAEGSL